MSELWQYLTPNIFSLVPPIYLGPSTFEERCPVPFHAAFTSAVTRCPSAAGGTANSANAHVASNHRPPAQLQNLHISPFILQMASRPFIDNDKVFYWRSSTVIDMNVAVLFLSLGTGEAI